MFRLRITASCLAVLMLTGITAPVMSQEKPSIAEEALTAPTVQFENRTNRRATPAARQMERNIGVRLAENAIEDKTEEVAGVSIFRIFDPGKERYGADVIVLGPKTNFGHIMAVQRVLAGYLQRAFEFEPEQANTMSLFIIYYNAEIRSRPELIEKSFSEAVVNRIDAKKAGIARSYKEWPGQTMLLIPLRKNIVRPDKADVDRQEIVEETQNNDSVKPEEKDALKKIDEERKAEDESRLDQKQQELDIKQQQIEQKKQELEKKEQEITADLVDTGKKLEELRKDPVKNAVEIQKEEQKQQELAKKQEELKQQEQEVKKQEETVTQQQQEVQEQKSDPPSRKEEQSSTADTDSSADQPATEPGESDQAGPEEAQKDSTEAAKEESIDETIATLQKEKEELQKEIEKKEQISENVVLEKILFMRVKSVDRGHYSNELWYVDTNKDDTLFRSPFNKICSRDFVVVPEQGVLVAGYAGESHEQGDHFLVLLDQENLEFKKQSNESVFWNTPMILRDDKIYAIESYNGQYYLSRFNPDLTLDARSSDGMSPHSDITFFKDKIYVTGQDKDGKPTTIQVFSRADLTLLKTITPPK